jgi:DUF1009 family protein
MVNDAGPLGILAGGGTLPGRVAEAAVNQGRQVFLVALQGQADPSGVENHPHIWSRLGEAGRIIAELKNARVKDLVLAGAVRRPSLPELGLDWRGIQFFARVGARSLGDDGLLSAIARELELEGFTLIGADKIIGAPPAIGVLGRHAPDEQAIADIVRGVEVALALGMADVGQAVVVQQGLVLGVEASEGTDALLERAASLRREGPGGVLIKIAKPQQDHRVDLPTIGPQTIALAASAGLRGIAIEADKAIVLDRELVIDRADQTGLFVIAIDPKSPIRL